MPDSANNISTASSNKIIKTKEPAKNDDKFFVTANAKVLTEMAKISTRKPRGKSTGRSRKIDDRQPMQGETAPRSIYFSDKDDYTKAKAIAKRVGIDDDVQPIALRGMCYSVPMATGLKALSVASQQLLLRIVEVLGQTCSGPIDTDKKYMVRFDLKEYARLRGIQIDPIYYDGMSEADQKIEAERARERYKKCAADTRANIKAIAGLAYYSKYPFYGIPSLIIDSYSGDSDKEDAAGYGYIDIHIRGQFAALVVGNRIHATHNERIYTIPPESANAWALYNMIENHFYMDANQRRGIAGHLKVKSMIDKLPDVPTIEEVRRAEDSWQRKIRKPLEDAIETLVRLGLILDYKIIKDGEDISIDSEVDFGPMEYEKWANSVYIFDLPAPPPEYKERLAKNAAAIKKGAKKKERSKPPKK